MVLSRHSEKSRNSIDIFRHILYESYNMTHIFSITNHYFKKSYEIEQKFYERYSNEISHPESNCKVPKCFGSSQNGAQVGYQVDASVRLEDFYSL